VQWHINCEKSNYPYNILKDFLREMTMHFYILNSSSFSAQTTTTATATATATAATTTTTPADILDPSNPQLGQSDSESVNKSGWRVGAKRILGSVAGVCQRLNQLLLKVVAKIFPWNRRAKRRLRGGAEDEEL
jgi:hypothetical protein